MLIEIDFAPEQYTVTDIGNNEGFGAQGEAERRRRGASSIRIGIRLAEIRAVG